MRTLGLSVWPGYEYVCDRCHTQGTEDDGCEPGGNCPDEDCYGTVHRRREFWHYWYDDEVSGMEYWHDGEYTRHQCHDAVGQITERHQSFDDFIVMFPNAEQPA